MPKLNYLTEIMQKLHYLDYRVVQIMKKLDYLDYLDNEITVR